MRISDWSSDVCSSDLTLIRLSLTDFRNHAGVDLGAGPGLVALHGDNGAGKTHILETISLTTPGPRLRSAPLGEMVAAGASCGCAVFAGARKRGLSGKGGTGTVERGGGRQINKNK